MNTMYFQCSTLRSMMRVTACEQNRQVINLTNPKVACMECTKWQTETTDPANLKTQEEMLNPVQQELEKPQPMKFNLRGEINRVCSLHIGHTPKRKYKR